MTEPSLISTSAQATIGDAAALLAGAARADRVSAEVALLCLAATQRLETLDVTPERAIVTPTRVRPAIAKALQHLGNLPEETFALPAVLDAASFARRAHQLQL